MASVQCTEIKTFGLKLHDEIRSADHAVTNLVEKQVKQDVSTGNTPHRVTRTFPAKLVQGTPDEIRKHRFRQVWNASAVKMDFESDSTMDTDLIEAEIEEDTASEASLQDDTRDSMFSSEPLSRQDSGSNLSKGIKKTSRTNLSEASTDTGILGDLENKVSFKLIRYCS